MRTSRSHLETRIELLNRLTGIAHAEWNTPLSFGLSSYVPGSRRLYSLERVCSDSTGVNIVTTGSLKEVRQYVDAMILGIDIARGNERRELL